MFDFGKMAIDNESNEFAEAVPAPADSYISQADRLPFSGVPNVPHPILKPPQSDQMKKRLNTNRSVSSSGRVNKRASSNTKNSESAQALAASQSAAAMIRKTSVIYLPKEKKLELIERDEQQRKELQEKVE